MHKYHDVHLICIIVISFEPW